MVLALAACGPGNQPPRIESLNANPPAVVLAGTEVRLQLNAVDPDGDPFTVGWAQVSPGEPQGTFAGADSPTATWTAPDEVFGQVFALEATATDRHGAASSVTVELAGNRPPVVAEAFATPASVASGQQVVLEVIARDDDGDSLHFLWNQVSPAWPQGSFFTPREARTPWTAPVVAEHTPLQLRVQVLDGRGARVERRVDVVVQRPNEPPTITQVQGPATVVSGDIVRVQAHATDPDGDPLVYSWSQPEPALQGRFLAGKDEAVASWLNSENTAGTLHTLMVSVTDGKSPPVTRTLQLMVTIPKYTTDIQPIWSARCLGCHSGTNPSAGLNLSGAGSHAALVNAGTLVDSCKTLKRVSPGNPDLSSLILKMTDVACGSRMPRDEPAYFDGRPGEVVRIRTWVRAGAFAN